MKNITMGQVVMSNILRISYINGINDECLSDIMGISQRTLHTRKIKPETLTIKEIESFCKTTKTNTEEIVKWWIKKKENRWAKSYLK